METSQNTTQPPSRWKITTAGIILAAISLCCGLIAGILLLTFVQDNSPITPIPPATQAAALPTYTNYPTYTIQPTTKPTIKLVTATRPPGFVELYRFTGNGRESTDLFTLLTGTIKITWVYIGDSNFAFYLKRLDNDASILIENTVGDTNGQKILNVGSSDQYLFDIEYGDGNWKINVEYRP